MTAAMTTDRRARTSQVRALARLLTGYQLNVLVWAFAIGIAINILAYFIPTFIEIVVGDKEISGRVTFFGAPVMAVAITAFVVAIVNAGYSRLFISQGASRRAVAAGNLVSLAVVWLVVIAVALASMLLWDAIPRPDHFMPLFENPPAAGFAIVLMGALAAVLVLGALIATVFQRWHWLVGVVSLVIMAIVLPNVIAARPVLIDAVTWPGFPWIVAAAFVGLYLWMVRGIEVK